MKIKEIPVIIILAVLVGQMASCKFIREKGWFGGKITDTMEVYLARMDSLHIADSLEMVRRVREREIQDSIDLALSVEQARRAQFRFHMILGSFKVPSNADRYVEVVRNMGFDARIIYAPRGWHLVSAQAFDNRRDAFRQVRAMKAQGRDAWVYASP